MNYKYIWTLKFKKFFFKIIHEILDIHNSVMKWIKKSHLVFEIQTHQKIYIEFHSNKKKQMQR